MSNKKTNGRPKKKDEEATPFLVRPDNARLVERLDAYAKSIRNSRNMAAVILLDKALAEAGF